MDEKQDEQWMKYDKIQMKYLIKYRVSINIEDQATSHYLIAEASALWCKMSSLLEVCKDHHILRLNMASKSAILKTAGCWGPSFAANLRP
jgi:hypothetical protein